ncbi:MAG TPA: S8 family serine peptidase, partial [Candidatus Nitrosotenuis sp.]|nr:S8 family serine peptidase [Candidatus Nitrosotenuis sp.]
MRFQKIIFCLFVITIVGFLASQRVQQDQVLETLLDKSAKYVGVDYPHSLGYTGDGIKVAVIDTGVDYTHPDLLGFGPEGKVIGGYDFVENDDTPQDTNGHGTEVAGIIAANGNLKGIAPDAKILAYRVSDTGNAVSSDLIVSAIERAVKDGANIINISLGVNRTNNKIDDAINFAVKNGVVVVAAAGNSGPDPSTIGSPGKDPNAITVGATYNNITASLVATLTVDHKRIEVLPMVGSKPLSNPITSEIVYGGY